MNIDFVIIDYMGQFAKPVSFSHLALLELELDSFDIIAVVILGGVCDGGVFWDFLMARNLDFE